MNPTTTITLEVRSLIEAVCDGMAADAQVRNLGIALADRRGDSQVLRRSARSRRRVAVACSVPYKRAMRLSRNSLPLNKRPQHPAPTFLSTTFPSTLGYSSGWPVAYLTATVITGLWILSMWLTPVSPSRLRRISAADRRATACAEPLPVSVGRITGMVDCKDRRFSCFLGAESRLGFGFDGNHLRHRCQGHLAGAGDV